MIDGKINIREYKIVAACALVMWIDKRLSDSEYYGFMNRLNDYAQQCGIKEKENENLNRYPR